MAKSGSQNVLRDAFHSLRYILYFSVVFSFAYSALKLSGPLFMILIFDRVLPSRSSATLVALLILLIIILVAMTLLDYSRRRILGRFGARFQERIEDHIFSSAARDTYYGRTQTKPAPGLNEVDKLRGFFHSGSLVTILDFLWSPLFMVAVFIISPWIGWVVVAGMLVLGLITLVKLAFAKNRDERFSEAGDKIDEMKERLLVSRDVIESQQMMAAFNDQWVQARRRARDRAIELKDWNAWFTILSSHTARLIQYGALAAGAYLAINGQMTVGAMVASMYLSRNVFYPMERFLQQIPSIIEAVANWKGLDKILKAPRPAVVPADAVLEGTAPLRLLNVTVRSAGKRKLLSNLNLEVAPGSSVQIVGNSGSGKTVFAEALIGRCPRSTPGGSLLDKQAGCRRVGDILLGVVDIERVSIADAARTVGYVPQQIAFVAGTIEENIAGLTSAPDQDRIVQMMRLAQMHDRILALPEGYRTRIDTAGSIFSKSERHQLALARALYPNPILLVVDEPDQTLREGLSRGMKSEIGSFLGRGGILIIFSRLALKTFKASRRFTLEEGSLREVELELENEGKVIRIRRDDESADGPVRVRKESGGAVWGPKAPGSNIPVN
ncbi:MAG: ABC transporter transmembrane domain-containing protein [Candidatus Devosia phytovorans]|uniref:ABC transporter transmembrane domain-containing protein n=1 Tax=Candidatus Devosia phytovorans TaxID=3121372 RepID=A0AAJ5VVM1_9HYPH|nr:ABC transporter transmembrane domain-containing protein [Devosia sp.]WEK04367.1 MAG: ABC transporter transmembrane domain-containing protein [Devosia sp.]